VEKHRNNSQYFKRKKLQRKFFNQLNIQTKIILEEKKKRKKESAKKKKTLELLL
jgi:hypothetical protein